MSKLPSQMSLLWKEVGLCSIHWPQMLRFPAFTLFFNANDVRRLSSGCKTSIRWYHTPLQSHWPGSGMLWFQLCGIWHVPFMERRSSTRYKALSYFYNTSGDKTNHVAGIHVPQLLYCAVFIAVFSAPLITSYSLLLGLIHSSISSVRKMLRTMAILTVLLFTVHVNTYT